MNIFCIIIMKYWSPTAWSVSCWYWIHPLGPRMSQTAWLFSTQTGWHAWAS